MMALVSGHDEKAERVGEPYGISRTYRYDELDDVLASDEVDAVYLATPNSDHVECAVRILDAHLLLKKPSDG